MRNLIYSRNKQECDASDRKSGQPLQRSNFGLSSAVERSGQDGSECQLGIIAFLALASEAGNPQNIIALNSLTWRGIASLSKASRVVLREALVQTAYKIIRRVIFK